jgi:hypothetical protein
MHSSLHSCTFGQKAPRRSLVRWRFMGPPSHLPSTQNPDEPEVDGKPKNCGPVAHRLRESIASPIAAILYARGCPRGILALLPAAVGPVAQLGFSGLPYAPLFSWPPRLPFSPWLAAAAARPRYRARRATRDDRATASASYREEWRRPAWCHVYPRLARGQRAVKS